MDPFLLATEKGGHLHCTASNGGCPSIWPPLLVSKGSKIGVGKGVKGKIGEVSRSKTLDQVTFNSYPVYSYTGDSGPAQQNGEGITSFGGTWYMVRATSTTAANTPVK